MLRSSVFSMLAASLLSIFGVAESAAESDPKANKLFVEAVLLYRSSEALSGDEKAAAYREVRALFDQILADHSGSKPAGVIAEGGSPGGVVLSSLSAATPDAWNDAKRALAQEILDAYGGDTKRISEVAKSFEWAMLACASYSDDGRTCEDEITGRADLLVSKFGWSPTNRVVAELELVGQAVAFLYVHTDGRQALVFRGTDEALDFVTNFAGSADPSFLNSGQLMFAVQLAEEAVKSHDNTVFVGHSLGGRLAQIGAFATNRQAFAFDSAPLGVWETIRYQHKMAQRGNLVTRLRGPDDPVSLLANQKASEQIEISNMVRTGDDKIKNLAGVAMQGFAHSMPVLAGAIQDVYDAERLGWIAELLHEQRRQEVGERTKQAERPSRAKTVNIANQACSLSEHRLPRSDILKWAAKAVHGRTDSGADWNLDLWNLTTSEVGPAVFTNSKSEKSNGLWKPLEGQLCQSYNKGASWACHSVFACGTKESQRFALQNDAGDFTSIVTLSEKGVRQTTAEVTGSSSKTKSVSGGWGSESDVQFVLDWITKNAEPFEWRGCKRSYGPLNSEIKRRLLQDTKLTIRRGSRTRVLGTSNSMLDTDNFCVGNNAECAVSRMQLYYCASGENIFWTGGTLSVGLYEIIKVERNNASVPDEIDVKIAPSGNRTARVVGKNCSVPVLFGSVTGARWDGRCNGNGTVTGPGTLTWMQGNDVFWRTRVGERWGFIVEDGIPRVKLDLADFEFSMKQCNAPIRDLIRTVAIVPSGKIPDAYFENSFITDELFAIGLEYGRRACPDSKNSMLGITVEITRDKTNRSYAIASARNSSETAVSLTNGQNEVVRKLSQSIKQENQNRRANEQRIAAEREAKRQAAQIRDLQSRLESQWTSHMDDMFSGQYVIENVGDLLQYNKPRAIGLLSQGVTLKLATQNMNFQDGTVVISDEHDPTDVLKPVRDAARAQMGALEAWLDTTSNVGRDYSGPSVNVICRLSASSLEHLDGQSSARFDARMQSLNGRSAVFDCELAR